MQGLNQWTFHPIVEEQDIQLPGHLITHLARENNTLIGTITNTLPTAVSDAFILFEQHAMPLGRLEAGQTRQVLLDIPTTQQGNSLAAQIIAQQKLPTNYFPYQNNQQPQNELQRHMALLSALDGNGYIFPPAATRV